MIQIYNIKCGPVYLADSRCRYRDRLTGHDRLPPALAPVQPKLGFDGRSKSAELQCTPCGRCLRQSADPAGTQLPGTRLAGLGMRRAGCSAAALHNSAQLRSQELSLPTRSCCRLTRARCPELRSLRFLPNNISCLVWKPILPATNRANMASAALKGPGVVLGDIKKLNAASLPKLWHWESEAHGLLNPMDGSTSHCQAPQSIPALGLFVFDDFQTIYVIDLKQQKAQLRKAIPVKSYLYGWTHAEGKLFVVDGAMLSSYELADGDVTLAAHLDLQDGLGNSKILYASLRRAKQRVAWDVFQKLLALNLLFLGFSEVKGGSEQDSQELGIPNEWLTKPRVSFLKADDMTSEEADSKEPLAMPRPPLAGPPKRVPRETLEGDLSTSFLLALIEALQVLGIVYRQELDAPTLCAYLQDNPLELRLFEKYHAESQGTLTLTQQELAQLRSSIPAFSVPVLKKNAEGSGDNLFVLRSDGTILGCNSSLRQAQAEKGFAPATVTKYRGTGTQVSLSPSLFLHATRG